MNLKFSKKILEGFYDTGFANFVTLKKDSWIYHFESKLEKEDVIEFLMQIRYFSYLAFDHHLLITQDNKKIRVMRKLHKIFQKGNNFGLYDWALIEGYFLDYPECCVKKYAEESENVRSSDLISLNSAKRYIEQLKVNKIKKDLFGVKIHQYGIEYNSVIPCHPKCKNALKYLKMSDIKNA